MEVHDIRIEEESIEYVKEYICLGQLMSFENNSETELKQNWTRITT